MRVCMRRCVAWIGLFSLAGIALMTVSINVKTTRRAYRIGEELREEGDLRRLVSYRRSRCRHMLRTEELTRVLASLGLDDKALYPEPSRPLYPEPGRVASLALGAP